MVLNSITVRESVTKVGIELLGQLKMYNTSGWRWFNPYSIVIGPKSQVKFPNKIQAKVVLKSCCALKNKFSLRGTNSSPERSF